MPPTYLQPQPNTVEALDDAGLEAIRANFEVLFRQAVQANLAFSVNLTSAVGSGTGYLKNTAGILSTQAVPIPTTDGGTGTITTFTAGSVVFAGTSGVYTQDNSNLFWDDINNYLGIGTPSPNSVLYISRGTGVAKVTLVAADGTNDAWFNFETNNNEWSFGIDKSDSNKFKLSNNDTIGSNDYITVDTSGHILGGVAGSAASPTFSYTSDSNTGIYFDGSDNLYLAAGGSYRAIVSSAGVTVAAGLAFTTESGNDLNLTSSVNRSLFVKFGGTKVATIDAGGIILESGGKYSSAAGVDTVVNVPSARSLLVQLAGTTKLEMNNSAQWLIDNGGASAPALAARSDANTGWYFDGSDGLLAATGGTLRLTLNTTSLTSTLPYLGANGSNSAPTFSFSNDSNTGMYGDGNDALSFTTAGTRRGGWSSVGGFDTEYKVVFSGSVAPSQLTGNTNDYNPTGFHDAFILNINSSGAINLTGLDAGTSGELHMLYNSGGFTITLVHDATSSSSNRFYTSAGAGNISLRSLESKLLVYYSSRWHVIGAGT